jgi:hypothetical protein
MFDLKEKDELESDFDSNSTKLGIVPNSLDNNNCLFTPELLTMLLRSYKDESTYFKHSSKSFRKVVKNKEGVYLIAFSTLNKEKKSLVYNYIYYNDLLYLTLIVYFLVRNFFINKEDNEWGKYLVIIDNIFLNYRDTDKYISLNSKDKTRN